MAPPKPSLTSQARAAELNAATAARARSMGGELGDFSELPSSQPISLGDITMRNHSRNKGSKSWKPFPQENMPNHLNGPAEALRRPQRPVDRYYPPMVPPATYPHMPPPLHMNPQMPYYGQPAYPVPDFQYPMYQGMYYYQQMYPGQIGYYQPGPAQTPIPAPALANVPVPAPVPALAPTPAPVPTPATTPVILTNKPAVSNPEFAVDPMKRQDTPVNCFVPQDMSPTKQEEDMIRSKSAAYERVNDKPQEKARGQTHASPDDTSAANPSVCEKSTQREHYCTSHLETQDHFQLSHNDSSPTPDSVIYPFRQENICKDKDPISQSKAADLCQVSSTQAALLEHSSQQEDATGETAERGIFFNEGCEPRSVIALVRDNHDDFVYVEECSQDVQTTKKLLFPGHMGISGTQFETDRTLSNSKRSSFVVEKSICDFENPFIAEHQPSGLQSPFQPHSHSPVLFYEPLVNEYEKNIFASEKSCREALAKLTPDEAWKEFQEGPRRVKIQDGFQSSSKSSHTFGSHSSVEKTGAKRFLYGSRPPPGLTVTGTWAPTASRENHTSSYYDRAILSDDWFRQGNRLKDRLLPDRRKLDLELERMLKDGDKPISNTEAARQTSNAFQMVIANFYSYKTGKAVNKFLAFSHFGPVSDEYCEPRYGGRRSYFENDPSLRQWRMQMARMSRQLPCKLLWGIGKALQYHNAAKGVRSKFLTAKKKEYQMIEKSFT